MGCFDNQNILRQYVEVSTYSLIHLSVGKIDLEILDFCKYSIVTKAYALGFIHFVYIIGIWINFPLTEGQRVKAFHKSVINYFLDDIGGEIQEKRTRRERDEGQRFSKISTFRWENSLHLRHLVSFTHSDCNSLGANTLKTFPSHESIDTFL